MTTSIVENWAVVLGQVLTIGPSDEPQGFDIVEIKVDEIHEVEGYPNLVALTSKMKSNLFYRY